jgi:hypothetical protein
MWVLIRTDTLPNVPQVRITSENRPMTMCYMVSRVREQGGGSGQKRDDTDRERSDAASGPDRDKSGRKPIKKATQDVMRDVLAFTAANKKTPKPATAAATPERPARTQSKSASAPRRKTRRIASVKRSRGDNARHIAEALSALPNRTGPAAALRKALAAKGIDMPYTSIRHALGQLQARGEASIAEDGRTWSYTARQQR